MQRPAVVLSGDDFNQSGRDLIVAQITSNVSTQRVGDHVISGWQQAGLLKPSVARAKLATLMTSKVRRTLGRMPAADMMGIEGRIRAVLRL